MAEASFAVETLELPAVRDMLARHTSFSASRALASTLEPSNDLREVQRRQATTARTIGTAIEARSMLSA